MRNILLLFLLLVGAGTMYAQECALLSGALAGARDLRQGVLDVNAGGCSLSADVDGNWFIGNDSGVTGLDATSGVKRPVGTVVLRIRLTAPTEFRNIFTWSTTTAKSASGNVGVGLSTDLKVQGTWNGAAWTTLSTGVLQAGWHVITVVMGQQDNSYGTRVYVDGSASCYSAGGLKTSGVTFKYVLVDAAVARRVNSLYAWSRALTTAEVDSVTAGVEALEVTEDSTVTMTFNYRYNGALVKSVQEVYGVGESYTSPALTGYSTTPVSGTADEDAAVEVACVPYVPYRYVFIANDNDTKLQMSDEAGTLTFAQTADRLQDKYIWQVGITAEGRYTFRNVGTGRYLKHKGVQEAAYEFELRRGIASGNFAMYSVADSRYLVIKYDGSLDQATGTYSKSSTNFSSDFIFEEAVINTLTISSQPAVSGIFSWNGQTKLGSVVTFANIQGVTPDSTAISAADNGYSIVLSDSVWDGQQDLTVKATVKPAFVTSAADFEAGTDIKWVRIENVRNAYALTAVSGESALHSTLTDVADEGQLFAVVGNSVGKFRLYSRVCGATPFGYATNTEGSAVTCGGSLSTFKAVFNATNDCPGYNIMPTSNSAQSFNMYGGTGADIRLYGVADGGSTWNFVPVTEDTITVALTEENPYANNYQLARLTTSYGSTASTSILMREDVGSKSLYIPRGLTPVLGIAYQYHGYKAELQGTTVSFAYDGSRYQYLWYEHPDYQFYRIPAIVTTRTGRLIAFSDYRYCHNDIGFGRVDQYMRASDDDGLTWSAPRLVLQGTDDTPQDAFYKGFGDPALVADRESDRVLLMTVAGNNFYGSGSTNYWNGLPNYFARTYSEDGGQTWSEPEDVTDRIYKLFASGSTDANAVTKAFVGSGKIFQSRTVKVGDYYRLYAALCAAPGGNRVIYSDDFGQTWAVLGGADARPAPSGDEPKCEELPDGSVILSSRKYYGRYYNIFTYSTAPTATAPAEGAWGTCVASNEQTGGISVGGNSTNGEIMVVKALKPGDEAIHTVVLQSLPFGSNRSQVGLWWKDITDASRYQSAGINSPATFASNWNKGLQVEDIGYSAYSTFTLQDDGRIGFFYEESPGTYAMVYIPLGISEITGGVYSDILTPSMETSIHALSAPEEQSGQGVRRVQAIYNTAGARQPCLQPGANILRLSNGGAAKVLVR